jgi:hypothetical protein
MDIIPEHEKLEIIANKKKSTNAAQDNHSQDYEDSFQLGDEQRIAYNLLEDTKETFLLLEKPEPVNQFYSDILFDTQPKGSLY